MASHIDIDMRGHLLFTFYFLLRVLRLTGLDLENDFHFI